VCLSIDGGHIEFLLVGDARSLFLPDLSDYRRAQSRLCGLRLVHTHLGREPLTREDLTDLALLRLDLVAAIEVTEKGQAGQVHIAHLIPTNGNGRSWEISNPQSVQDLKPDFFDLVDDIEKAFASQVPTQRPGDKRTRAILVHVSEKPRNLAEDSIQELEDLAQSAGMHVLGKILQRRPPDPRFVMGEGRFKETLIDAMQSDAEALVFDMNLSPAQVASLSSISNMKILDRSLIILDIFAQHAVSREGMLQVELAQLRYMLPRLGAKQRSIAFSRLTGGIGGRGPGETKLEIDKRRVKDRIALLERQLNKLTERRRLRRQVRVEANIPTISVVGYTNVGKSTIVNQLTGSNVSVQDALFATLDPVSRRLRFPHEREAIVTDTVGFIRNLPEDLLDAFRATLEELHEADVLVHVLDASSKHIEEQYQLVRDMLAQLGLQDKSCINILNKTDKIDRNDLPGLCARFQALPICALDRRSLLPLTDALSFLLWGEKPIMSKESNVVG